MDENTYDIVAEASAIVQADIDATAEMRATVYALSAARRWHYPGRVDLAEWARWCWLFASDKMQIDRAMAAAIAEGWAWEMADGGASYIVHPGLALEWPDRTVTEPMCLE